MHSFLTEKLIFSFSKYNFTYLLFGCAGSSLLCGLFSCCGEQGLLSLVRRLLIAVASLVAEQGLEGTRASAVVA